MPGGVPDRLSPEAAGQYALIGGLLSQGIGADRAYAIIRDQGIPIPRAVVRGIYAEIRVSLGQRAELSRINPDNPVPLRLVSTTTPLHTHDFVHRVSILKVDPVTGYQVQQYASFVSSERVSPNQAVEAFTSEDLEQSSTVDFDVIAASLIDVLHRPF